MKKSPMEREHFKREIGGNNETLRSQELAKNSYKAKKK
jgi:hypothetical protein